MKRIVIIVFIIGFIFSFINTSFALKAEDVKEGLAKLQKYNDTIKYIEELKGKIKVEKKDNDTVPLYYGSSIVIGSNGSEVSYSNSFYCDKECKNILDEQNFSKMLDDILDKLKEKKRSLEIRDR